MSRSGYLWIEDYLGYAFSIPQVDEYQAAMVATPVNPPRQSYHLACMFFS